MAMGRSRGAGGALIVPSFDEVREHRAQQAAEAVADHVGERGLPVQHRQVLHDLDRGRRRSRHQRGRPPRPAGDQHDQGAERDEEQHVEQVTVVIGQQPGRVQLVRADDVQPQGQLAEHPRDRCERQQHQPDDVQRADRQDPRPMLHGPISVSLSGPSQRIGRARWRPGAPCGSGPSSGVTSTHSSSRQNSRHCSSDSSRGGISFSNLSEVDGAHVGQLLLLGDVDVHVVGAGVLADDHALVDLGGRLARTACRAPAGSIIANGVTTPARSATSEPLRRVAISPAHGS